MYNHKDFRTVYMQARDRILYCRPFLRLAGKAQVYSTNFGDHVRTRLTHSLEVAQIARTIVIGLNKNYNLNINEELIEAIALGHDLGHTPFGHIGERTLHAITNYKNIKINDILFRKGRNKKENFKECFIDNDKEGEFFNQNRGFKHNWQGVRILQYLCRECDNGDMFGDIKDPNVRINVLKGILCHSSLCKNNGDYTKDSLSFYDKQLDLKNFDLDKEWNLEKSSKGIEMQIVNYADEIAQRHHDIEDAITFNLITPQVATNIIWGKDKAGVDDVNCPESLHNRRSEICNYHDNSIRYLRSVSSIIVDFFVRDLISNYQNKGTLSFTTETEEYNKRLSVRLQNIILKSVNVKRMDSRGQYIIEELFKAYATNPLQMPDETLNAVFREYLRQYSKHIETDINIKRMIEKLLANKSGFDLFKERYLIRVAFEDCCYNERAKYIILKRENIRVVEKSQGAQLFININRILFQICLMRVITDYIAGMTDYYAEQEYCKLYGIVHNVLI